MTKYLHEPKKRKHDICCFDQIMGFISKIHVNIQNMHNGVLFISDGVDKAGQEVLAGTYFYMNLKSYACLT